MWLECNERARNRVEDEEVRETGRERPRRNWCDPDFNLSAMKWEPWKGFKRGSGAIRSGVAPAKVESERIPVLHRRRRRAHPGTPSYTDTCDAQRPTRSLTLTPADGQAPRSSLQGGTWKEMILHPNNSLVLDLSRASRLPGPDRWRSKEAGAKQKFEGLRLLVPACALQLGSASPDRT